MSTILHLERKFTSKTETFIVNQVNSVRNFNLLVGTVLPTGLLQCSSKIIAPDANVNPYLKGRYLSSVEVKGLMGKLASADISLIHTHYLVDAWFFRPFTRRFTVPKVVSVYGYDVSSFPGKYWGLGKKMLQSVFREYSTVLAMSEDMQQDLIALGCPSEKIRVHYYGTDCTRFKFQERAYDTTGAPIRVLTVGTIEEKKAQHLVIQALAEIRERTGFTNFEYHIVGDGPGRSKVEQAISRYGLAGKVVLHGYVNYFDPGFPAHYHNADLFVHPSQTTADGDKEGIPGTIIEAMASGLPVVATFHAGIPSVITSGSTGALVREGNVAQLSEVLYALMANPEKRAALGRAATKHALERLDLVPKTAELEGMYSELILKGIALRK